VSLAITQGLRTKQLLSRSKRSQRCPRSSKDILNFQTKISLVTQRSSPKLGVAKTTKLTATTTLGLNSESNPRVQQQRTPFSIKTDKSAS
jgi:hypothetical protein